MGSEEHVLVEMTSEDDEQVAVGWQRIPPTEVSPPIVRRLPLVELKLEHPELEPGGHGTRFFPDAVPYSLDGVPRIFYWRPDLAASPDNPRRWEGAVATTHHVRGLGSLPAAVPSLVTEGAEGTTVVVDGTIGGETTTTHVRSYTAPDVRIMRLSDAQVALSVADATYSVATGERRRIRLAEQRVTPVDTPETAVAVTPELFVRFPGRRELHHPAPGATYRVFPSFGIDLTEIPNPLPVPTVTGELDRVALADQLNVDLSERPYAERVLWQAFTHTAFDPHVDGESELTQLETGHIVLQSGGFTAE